ncbi:hypothetical protein CHARACLAT_003632 [Characodon lateralis]|uniref:Uncharacterized protein n=1 Tax=Characodon lateralis TaxID=208331 RepID=A0ABU7DN08_9TELE|nr:hypothetical protein [Characodon lateralis]
MTSHLYEKSPLPLPNSFLIGKTRLVINGEKSRCRRISRCDCGNKDNPVSPATLADLQQMMVEEWDGLPQQCVTKLVISMGRRYQAAVVLSLITEAPVKKFIKLPMCIVSSNFNHPVQ